MKKFRVLFPVIAILFAVASAFAFQPKEDGPNDTYKPHATISGLCDMVDECTLTSPAAECDFTPKNQQCQTIVRWRPF